MPGLTAAVSRRMMGSSPGLRAGRGRVEKADMLSCGHLGPEEPGELAGDGGDDDVAVDPAFVETAEPAAEADLGGPGSSEAVTGDALVVAAEPDADPGPGPVGPGGLDQLRAEVNVPASVM